MRKMRRLTLRHFLYLQELHRHGSFSRAATALAISQPTLSQQIAQMEEILGVELVERGPRLLKLTDDGRLMLERSRKILTLLGDTIDMLSGERQTATLRVGIPGYMSYPIVSDILRAFRESNSGVVTYLAELPAEEMSLMLNEGEIDIGFLSLPTPTRLDETMASQTIWEAPLLVCLQKQDALAARPYLTADDLRQLDFVLIPREYHRSHYDNQLASLKAFGFDPRLVRTDVSTVQSQMGLTSAGLGACLLSENTVPIPDDLVLKPTKPELCTHALALFWSPENRNPYLRNFQRVAAECARSR
ncbi:LysR family transcriptional regulator [Kaistia sp. 32K]|uniref:LysR family transcriptional regulator n=1 Tax=Kaistia sp. 32K TaxID=2795690 RepID=UPI001FD0A0DB|nr:LysR family transcriptional regulator [Kaistia sp. 32K]